MTASWSKINTQSSATAKDLIHVFNIGLTVTENQLRDFFKNCGSISQLELILPSGASHQEALIQFASPSSAMTALGLDGAVLADEYVKVKKFGATSESHLPEPVVKIAELLSKGIAPVASAGLQLDAKYHVAEKVEGLVESAKKSASTVDEKYHVTSTLSSTYHTITAQPQVNSITKSIQEGYDGVLNSSYAQKVMGVMGGVVGVVGGVVEETRKRTEEKIHQAHPVENVAPAASS